MRVYIVGEDDVTQLIIKKVLQFCSNSIEIISTLPARSSQVRTKVLEFNRLSLSYPVILLIDLDNEHCAPELMRKLLQGNEKNGNFILNIAFDEAESWLLADRNGFSRYYSIDLKHIPEPTMTKQSGTKNVLEMCFPYKCSMYITNELMKKSSNPVFVAQFTPKKSAAKGPEYNSGIIPFIRDRWNIDEAIKNSDSLNRMILRIQELLAS